MRGTFASLLLAAFSGCISISYDRVLVNEPVPDWVAAELSVGGSDLTECLAKLGAPTLVWRSRQGRLAMAYGWLEQAGFGIDISYNFDRLLGVRFEYDSIDAAEYGLVLTFDAELRLATLARGFLRDLVPSATPATATSRINRVPR